MPATFDPSLLATLQDHDTAIAQLRHRHTHLPIDQEIASLDAQNNAVQAAVSDSRTTLAQLSGKQADLETKIHDIDLRVDAAAKTLYSGTVTATRELQALEADIASLKKHRSELEDAEMEILIEREPLDAALAAADAQTQELLTQRADLAAQADTQRREIGTEVLDKAALRDATAAQISPEIVAIYDKVRAANRGIGAARLEHGSCMGCHLKLAAVELDRIRQLAPDTLVQCEECGAILLREAR